MKNIKRITSAFMAALFLLSFGMIPPTADCVERDEAPSPATTVCVYSRRSEPVLNDLVWRTIEVASDPQEPAMDEEDIKLIALLTMAEAEGECEEGQRLVIDTVLNRMDSGRYPNTIRDVIFQPDQYSGMQSPRIDHCWVRDDMVQLVREELENRTNSDVLFFRTEHYHRFGTPLFQVGNHYFSC